MDTLSRNSRLKGAIAGVGFTLIAATFVLPSIASAEDKYPTAADLQLMQGFPPPPDKQITKATALQTFPYIRW
ncbi:MAG: hypothetical protein ACWGQW_25955, partial [bacterium]